jgi:hypothetical protein
LSNKSLSFLFWGVILVLGANLGGCVTINIYFPAAAAEKAADKIIEEVWQLDQSKGVRPDSGDKVRIPAELPK